MFHSTVRAVALLASSLMRPLAAVERPVSRARAPRQTCRHCSVADLPEPFSPVMKFKCGLQAKEIASMMPAVPSMLQPFVYFGSHLNSNLGYVRVVF